MCLNIRFGLRDSAVVGEVGARKESALVHIYYYYIDPSQGATIRIDEKSILTYCSQRGSILTTGSGFTATNAGEIWRASSTGEYGCR